MGRIAGSAGTAIAPAILDVLNLNGEEHDLALSGNYAYTVQPGAHFNVIDITATPPAIVGTLSDATNFVQGDATEVKGSVCFVLTRGGKLSAVDVSTPASPVRISTLTDATNLNGAADMEIVGNYAYIAAATADKVAIVDISNTAAMTYVGAVSDATALKNPLSVFAVGNVLYVGCNGAGGGAGLATVNIATPLSAALLNFNAPGTACSAVHVNSGIAYSITSGSANRIDTFDVSNPSSIVHLGSLVDARLDRPLGVWAEGGVATIPCQTNDGVVAYVDVSTPGSPTYITRLIQDVAGNGITSDPGEYGSSVINGVTVSGPLYHAYRCVRRNNIDYIAVAGSGRLTRIALNRTSVGAGVLTAGGALIS